MPELTDRVGEVVEAGTTSCIAQCYELYEAPPLGSLVRTGDIYGIVSHAATTGLEPGRHPIARGKDAASEEAVYKDNPQLNKLFRSEFGVLVVGHRSGEKICQYLPPGTARIHGFVYRCPAEEVKTFSRSLNFLNMMINAELPVSAEELIAAALRGMSAVQDDPHQFLIAAGKELAVLLSGQYPRLRAIAGRLS
ncbi:MAG: hypothetical protein PHR56_00305 [Dehalococcoidales bacterium]|nr:hypothetical protein [Dehalococcoidales bacterium]